MTLLSDEANVENCPSFWPILSFLSTSTYKLAKFLVPILKPLTINEFTEKVSFHFAEEIVDHQPNFFWLIWIEIPYLLT